MASMHSMTHQISRSVVLLCFPPADIFDVAAPLEIFRLANLLSQPGMPYNVTVVNAEDNRLVETDAGVSLCANATIAQLLAGKRKISYPDTLIVVSGLGAIDRYPGTALNWIVDNRDQFRRICSVCLGAFPLAASGVLNGRRATTHWRMLDSFSRRYKAVEIDDSSIWVKDGKFYSSAGLSTGLDLTLGLVEEDLGSDLANDIAREMVLFIRRSGEHSQKSVPLEHQGTPNKRLQALQPWLMANLEQNLNADRLAERLSVSRRTLIRLFRSELNTTPAKYLESLRLEVVARCLVTTDWSLHFIARKCGFAGADVMRRAFQRKFSVSPTHYRQISGSARATAETTADARVAVDE